MMVERRPLKIRMGFGNPPSLPSCAEAGLMAAANSRLLRPPMRLVPHPCMAVAAPYAAKCPCMSAAP